MQFTTNRVNRLPLSQFLANHTENCQEENPTQSVKGTSTVETSSWIIVNHPEKAMLWCSLFSLASTLLVGVHFVVVVLFLIGILFSFWRLHSLLRLLFSLASTFLVGIHFSPWCPHYRWRQHFSLTFAFLAGVRKDTKQLSNFQKKSCSVFLLPAEDKQRHQKICNVVLLLQA